MTNNVVRETEESEKTFSERDLIGMLAGLLEIRKQRDRAARAFDIGKKPVADYIMKHGGVLRDGEAKVTAQYRDGGSDEHLDFKNLAEVDDGTGDIVTDGERIIIELANRGLLRLDVPGFARQEPEYQHGGTVRRFIYKTPRSQRFVIESE